MDQHGQHAFKLAIEVYLVAGKAHFISRPLSIARSVRQVRAQQLGEAERIQVITRILPGLYSGRRKERGAWFHGPSLCRDGHGTMHTFRANLVGALIHCNPYFTQLSRGQNHPVPAPLMR